MNLLLKKLNYIDKKELLDKFMSPKISIIIPFYNVENYIEKCINSVKAQTFTDFECLLIDDESADNSKKIAESLIEEESRFRIITQLNKRQGGARNTGLDNAKGDWITFLDSDDWWHRDFLEKMYFYATTQQIDIVSCKYENINKKGIAIGLSFSLPQGIYTNKNQLVSFFLDYPTVWNKIYSKKIWETLRFPEKVYYEDLSTTFQLVFEAKSVLFIDDVLVCYNLREGSTTKHFSEQQVSDKIVVFHNIEKTFLEKKVDTNLYLLDYIYLSHIVYFTCCDVIHFKTELCKKHLLKKLHKSWDKKYFNLKSIWKTRKKLGIGKVLFLMIYYFSPILFFYIFKLKNKLKK